MDDVGALSTDLFSLPTYIYIDGHSACIETNTEAASKSVCLYEVIEYR